MNVCRQIARKVLRAVLLLLLVTAGTIALMRFAPGYFTDAGEIDSHYGESARARLRMAAKTDGSAFGTAEKVVGGWLHADLGRSRQYDIPVSELIRPRLASTGTLLIRGIALGWLLSFAFALGVSGRRGLVVALGVPFTLLLALPTGALATVSAVSGFGGPVLVLTLLVAARDFRFLKSALDAAWQAPHLLHARAQGLSSGQMLRVHVLRAALPQLRALATMSLVTALGALVPVEVLFDEHGLGQLAWGAALNRDLPVLLTVTLLMAAAVTAANMLSTSAGPPERV